MSNQFTGRNIITTDLPEITRSNVLNLINDTKYLHDVNSNKINYLYNYYRGEQPIQQKTKETREEINNIVTENRAYEIVSFKKGYTFGEPVQCQGRQNLILAFVLALHLVHQNQDYCKILFLFLNSKLDCRILTYMPQNAEK